MPNYAEVWVELLPAEKGGRQSSIKFSDDAPTPYRTHLRIKTGDGEYLGVEFVDGPDEPLAPGESAFATVRAMYEPDVSYDALILGAEFEIVEGGKVVGTGRVTRI